MYISIDSRSDGNLNPVFRLGIEDFRFSIFDGAIHPPDGIREDAALRPTMNRRARGLVR